MEINVKKKSEKIEVIKNNIRDYHDYFKDNYEYYKLMMRFIFVTTLSQKERDIYTDLGWPLLEFPILEAIVSRILGEFSLQEPSIKVRQRANSNVDPMFLNLVEGNFRNIFTASNRDNMQYQLFRDCVGGGYSAMKIYTDYEDAQAHHQDIFMKRVFDPTLVGFDKMAVQSHKGDGQYCFEMFPMTRERFEDEYGKKYTNEMYFRKGEGELYGYDWSYCGGKSNEEMVLVADYYEKRYEKVKTVLLNTGQTMTEERYEKFAEDFMKKNFYSAPAVVGKARDAEIVKIHRTILCKDHILKDEETQDEILPIIFFDGNSLISQDKDGTTRQVVKSYVHHAVSTQKMKNLSGIMLANELENTMQHKLMISQQALPTDDNEREALTNFQKSKLVTYNGFKDGDSTVPLSPPTAVPRTNAPPEMIQAFGMMDATSALILGTQDSSLSAHNNDLSGNAMEESAMQSNMSVRPYLVNYYRALNQAAMGMYAFFPKIHTLPRTLPITTIRGEDQQVPINSPGGLQIEDFEANALEIVIEAGVDFEVQRKRAFNMLRGLASESPAIGEFLGTTPEGISMILDNIDMRGIDALKQAIPQFVNQLNQQKQMNMQMQQQEKQLAMQQATMPLMIRQKELELEQLKIQAEIQMAQAKLQSEIQLEQMKLQADTQVKISKLGIDQQNADTKQYEALSKTSESADKTIMDAQKVDAQNARTMVDAMHATAGAKHSHALDLLTLDHTKNMDHMKHKLDLVSKDLEHMREMEKIKIQKQAAQNKPAKTNDK